MKQKRRLGRVKILAMFMILCQVFSCMPLKSAEAGGAGAENFIAPENPSGQIKNKGFHLSAYSYHEDGSLTIKNTYHYVPGHRITYYTFNTIWSKVHSREAGEEGYPIHSGVSVGYAKKSAPLEENAGGILSCLCIDNITFPDRKNFF